MKQKKFKRLFAGVCALALAVTSVSFGSQAKETKAADGSELRLWYSAPADTTTYDSWEKWSLPMGNGGIGGSVFGGVEKERIQLNEKSLWSGGPSTKRPGYMGGNLENQGRNGALMKEIQEAFAAGNDAQAGNMANGLVGVADDAGSNGYGYYLSYGNMYLDFDGVTAQNVENYSRDLDLRTAVASVEYDKDGTHYTRENFTSYPDNVIVTHITAEDGDGKINLSVSVDPDNTHGGGLNTTNEASYGRTWEKTAVDGMLSVDGELKDNQMKFSSHTKVLADGQVTSDDAKDKVSVADATEVTIITSIGTDYKNDYPKYRTGETKAEVSDRVKAYVTKAAKKAYADLKADHIEDYDSIFGRVELNLGQQVSAKTTDALLAAYKNGSASEAERRYLEIMLFQFGRYLTIESSRAVPENDPSRETLPSNLQGMWVGGNNSAWHADYHMNVNLQMNYWPTYSTNMAECGEPLIAYIDSLREPGRVTAKVYAGIESTEANPENGFMAHTQNTPFGWTCPGWSFDWGWSPAAVPWMLQNCWAYYEYTGDTEYLRENIYPMMKEEAVLYDQMLVRDADGKLVSAPAYSPEHGPRTMGNTYEQTLVWQLYEDTIKAAEILGVDADKVSEWKANQKDLKGPIEIGDSGQIKEWYTEKELYKDAGGNTLGQGYGHRHMSHMLGLFPGDLISVETPEWLEAANVSMQNRTDESTGWGMGQRINTWARLGNGNKAYKLITDLFGKGILTNLWDTHPPFQIDGNFGYTSGVAEMLLQSNVGYMNLLPALPDVWAEGNVDGLKAQGDFEVSMNWADGVLTGAKIVSNDGKDAVVQFPNASMAKVTDSDGNAVSFTVVDDNKNRISFSTAEGETYTITDMKIVKTPSGLKADRCADDSAELTWEAADNAVYNVYRQADNGTLEKIAENISGNFYEDKNVTAKMETVAYRISAVVNGLESELSVKVIANDLRGMVGMIDDRDPRIQYEGAWNNWDESVNYGGTIKYLEKTTGNDTATLTFVGTGIEVISCTNADRGQVEITIDGKSQGIFDTYSPSTVRQARIFSKDDLKLGKHTIVVRATNTISAEGSQERWAKVELDAFNILNSTVPEITIVEDGTSEGTINEAITWSGSWSTWAGEPEKHHGGTKTETGNGAGVPGSYFEYQFEGTGIEVYVQKHINFASFDISIDGEKIGNYSLEGSADGDPQSLLFSKTDLTDGEHTIKCVAAERDGKYQVNLDYLKIIKQETEEEPDCTHKNAQHTEAKKPGCTENGNPEYWYCEACEHYFADEACTKDLGTEKPVLQAGHNLKEVLETKPTCTDVGTAAHWKCDVCGKLFSDVNGKTETTLKDLQLEKAAHTLREVKEEAATCEKEGRAAHWKCDVCGKLFSDREGKTETTLKDLQLEKAAHQWDEGKVTTEPTVEAEGIKTYTCTVCKATRTEKIDKLEAEKPEEPEKPVKPGKVQFVDIVKGRYDYEPIVWAYENSITKGMDETHFAPESAATRADMITFLCRANGSPKPSNAKNPFKDIEAGKYYYDAVLWAYENGITLGTDKTHFSPGQTITRAESVTFIYRVNGEPEVKKNATFKDLDEEGYYYAAVLWAAENGVVRGYNAETFAPNDQCVRGQVVTMLYNDAK